MLRVYSFIQLSLSLLNFIFFYYFFQTVKILLLTSAFVHVRLTFVKDICQTLGLYCSHLIAVELPLLRVPISPSAQKSIANVCCLRYAILLLANF